MRIDIDLDTNLVVSGPGMRDALRELAFKHDTSSVIDLRFWRDGAVVELAEGATGKFGIKQRYKFDGPLLVLAAEWSKSGEGTSTVYKMYPALNGVALGTLLGSGDADPDNDVDPLECMAEFRWIENDKKYRSNTVKTLVNNDVLKDEDGTPSSLPTSEDWWLEHVAPLELSIPPVNAYGAAAALGFAARHQTQLMQLAGSATSSGDIPFQVESSVAPFDVPGGVTYNIPVLNGDTLDQVTDKIVAFLLAESDFSDLYTPDGGTGVSPSGAISFVVVDTPGNDDDLHLSISTAHGVSCVDGSEDITTGIGPVTPVEYVGKLARYEPVIGTTVFFRAASETHWVGASNGLIFDEAPETGLPRWKIDGWDGVGAGRMFTKIDL